MFLNNSLHKSNKYKGSTRAILWILFRRQTKVVFKATALLFKIPWSKDRANWVAFCWIRILCPKMMPILTQSLNLFNTWAARKYQVMVAWTQIKTPNLIQYPAAKVWAWISLRVTPVDARISRQCYLKEMWKLMHPTKKSKNKIKVLINN